jgi:hypothetical protein
LVEVEYVTLLSKREQQKGLKTPPILSKNKKREQQLKRLCSSGI